MMNSDPAEDREEERPGTEGEAGFTGAEGAAELDDTSPLEDASDQPPMSEVTLEDDPEPLSHAARSFDEGATTAEPSMPHPVDDRLVHPDETSDIGEFEEEEPALSEEERRARGRSRWDVEPEIRHISSELRAIELEVRSLLEGRDPKRKRKLAGTRRWLELEEDVIALKHAGRIAEDALVVVQRLISRRHCLFRRLHFLSATRPTWNT